MFIKPSLVKGFIGTSNEETTGTCIGCGGFQCSSPSRFYHTIKIQRTPQKEWSEPLTVWGKARWLGENYSRFEQTDLKANIAGEGHHQKWVPRLADWFVVVYLVDLRGKWFSHWGGVMQWSMQSDENVFFTAFRFHRRKKSLHVWVIISIDVA